eukprot:112011-Chlamydomonas_euryale.AAC.1
MQPRGQPPCTHTLRTASVATAYDCTCGFLRHRPAESGCPSSGVASQLMVGPTSFTPAARRRTKGSVQCTRPCTQQLTRQAGVGFERVRCGMERGPLATVRLSQEQSQPAPAPLWAGG